MKRSLLEKALTEAADWKVVGNNLNSMGTLMNKIFSAVRSRNEAAVVNHMSSMVAGAGRLASVITKDGSIAKKASALAEQIHQAAKGLPTG